MIDVGQAVDTAFEWFNKFYSDSNVPSVLLEEVNLDEDENMWLVTIGFNRGVRQSFGAGSQEPPPRAFKKFKIDAESGEFLGLDARKL